MSMTALDLPPDTLKKYRPLEAVRRRKVEMRTELAKRRRRASLVARKAAGLLRTEFEAKEVILFGSLARHGEFNLYSDIDLAVRGIPPTRFFEAVGTVTGLSPDFKIDLIDLDVSSQSLREAIRKEGIPYE